VLAACATRARAPAFVTPALSLRQLTLVNADTINGLIDATILIRNPNSVSVEASNITYRLLADTIIMGSGQILRTVTMPPRDSILLTIMVPFGYAGFGPAARRDLVRAGPIPWTMMGEITFRTPSGDVRSQFSETGRYALFIR
jgi:LEA14-like dessication related protein